MFWVKLNVIDTFKGLLMSKEKTLDRNYAKNGTCYIDIGTSKTTIV